MREKKRRLCWEVHAAFPVSAGMTFQTPAFLPPFALPSASVLPRFFSLFVWFFFVLLFSLILNWFEGLNSRTGVFETASEIWGKTCVTAEPHKVHHKECTARGELHTEEKHIKNRLQKHSSTIYNRNNKKYRGYLWSVNKWAPIQARTTLLFHGSCFNVFRQIRGAKEKTHTQTNNSTLLCNVTAALPLNWDGVLWYHGQYEY